MKKILIAAFTLAAYGNVAAQTPEDALRYSWLQTSGTARSQGIANANGAIGGEISTIFSNPGNIGFYKTGDAVITGGLNLNNNTATYFGQSTKTNSSQAFLGTSGLVFGKQSYGKGAVKSGAFGFAINRTADFNNKISYKTKASDGGALVRTSMADYFIDDLVANGDNGDFNSQLALDAGWVKTETVNNETKLSSSAVDLAIASGLEQQQTITTNGGITEIGISGALNLNEKIYIGGTIGLPFLRYGVTKQYTEQDPDADNGTNNFDAAWLDEDLVTSGGGINIKAGIVVRASDNFRLGFAAHSPTFYSLTDNYWSSAGANLDDHDESYEHEFEYSYNLVTPYKLLGSFSLLFGNVNDVASQKGFLSGDVEYTNYMASSFKNSNDDGGNYDDYYSGVNKAIDNAYKGAVNARLGAELKFNPIAVRFGGAYYGNPYKDIAGEKGQLIQATGGLGYRNKGFFIDLGYVHNIGKDVVFPYRLTSAPFEPARIKSSSPRVLLTLGFKI